ncbi:histidinol phosphatase-like protein [Tolypothrix sp. NIES-4075]|uniref:D-glycero-alpha-D-manno-heptose-1,7-bisphosphate 7-phosphatase n=1 Tax=Tolypothrix sp. NIES-4075 TaxID=2005459 RepID=UPI000B5C2C3B|nr:HAD family hydrolase [Tolypothrix sp. NIES-4075]GAX44184.1 histidinol phosphatase-like protein [Tolypothrix sp. NIES-4075]
MRRALFLDRDGVINKEVNYLHKIQDFEFIEGIFETCRFFQDRNYLLIVVTNQSGIGRNIYSEDDFRILNDWMLQQFERQGVKINKVYYSPFHPKYGVGKYLHDSWCRKPNPGMLIQARDEFNINFCKSILVGDKESDIEAGLNAGVMLNVLVRSGHIINENVTKANAIIDSILGLPNFVYTLDFID